MKRRRFFVVWAICFLCFDFSYAGISPECIGAEIGMTTECGGSDSGSRVLCGASLGLYDIDIGGSKRRPPRLYGLSVEAVSLVEWRETVGLQFGLVSSCPQGAGLLAGVFNFVSDYKGIELGVMNCFSCGGTRNFYGSCVSGVQMGAVNINESKCAMQIGLWNVQTMDRMAKGDVMCAMQIGVLNMMEDGSHGRAIQFGFWNDAKLWLGCDFLLQLGVVNCLEDTLLDPFCVQVGIVNIMRKSPFDDDFSFLPFLSVTWP